MSSMPHRGGGFFHLHLVSDATGETLITVARAAAAQYATVAPIEHIYPLVRTEKQLDRVISEIEAAPGIVLYTMLDSALAERLRNQMPRILDSVPVDSRSGAGDCSSRTLALNPPGVSARSTRSTPNTSSASMR